MHVKDTEAVSEFSTMRAAISRHKKPTRSTVRQCTMAPRYLMLQYRRATCTMAEEESKRIISCRKCYAN